MSAMPQQGRFLMLAVHGRRLADLFHRRYDSPAWMQWPS